MTRMWWNYTSNSPAATSTGLPIRIADRSPLRLTRAGDIVVSGSLPDGHAIRVVTIYLLPLLVESVSRPAQVADHATNSLPNRHLNIRMTTLFVTSHRDRRLQQVGQYRYACLDKVAWNSTSACSRAGNARAGLPRVQSRRGRCDGSLQMDSLLVHSFFRKMQGTLCQSHQTQFLS